MMVCMISSIDTMAGQLIVQMAITEQMNTSLVLIMTMMGIGFLMQMMTLIQIQLKREILMEMVMVMKSMECSLMIV